jgi:uncharacterized protein YbjT (DUF2867 family)
MILVVGATGAVGGMIARRLLEAAMDTYDSPVDMTATLRAFDVQLTPAEDVLREILSAV